MQIPADDIVRQSLKLKVMSYKSSLNWNVTVTVGVISLLLLFHRGLMCTFTFMFRFYQQKKRENHAALLLIVLVSKCIFNTCASDNFLTFLYLTIDPPSRDKVSKAVTGRFS